MPGVSDGRRSCVCRLSSPRSVTSRYFAWAAPSTGRLTPFRRNSGPPARISSSTSRHQAAVAVPASSSARTCGCAPASPSAAATTFAGSSGPGAACRPNSWAMTDKSTRPRPLMLPPPASSLTSRDVQPSLGAAPPVAASQSAGIVAAIRCSSSAGTWSARNLAVVSRKNSWSGVRSSNMLVALRSCSAGDGPGRRGWRAGVEGRLGSGRGEGGGDHVETMETPAVPGAP